MKETLKSIYDLIIIILTIPFYLVIAILLAIVGLLEYSKFEKSVYIMIVEIFQTEIFKKIKNN